MRVKTVRLGVKNLLLHKLRSSLTVLGVILGVGSVIAMLAIGEGSKAEALEQIRRLGANNVIIRSVKPGQDDGGDDSSTNSQQQSSRILEYGLKHKDFERLKATLPTIKTALPISLSVRNAQRGRRRILNARILGTTPDYLEVKSLSIRRGRFLTSVDLTRMSNVAVLAAGAAERLFKYEDPLGQPVLLGDDVYRVVGLLAPQGSGTAIAGAIGNKDFNLDIYIPISAAQSRFGELQLIFASGSENFERTQLNEITLTVTDPSLVSQTAGMARKVLLRSHPRADDFEVQVPLELLRQAEEEKRIWNLVLGCIAGISLLVGGIGIMNIMLASVTERTREIGVRRALGAKRWDITSQFLVETVVLSATGGIVGVVLGVTIPMIVTYYSGIATVIQLWTILLAFGISLAVGMVFGIYPARRAALMDPIEALRHD